MIDPKGENTVITAKARQDMGQKVLPLDPWGIAQVEGIETARFNPMDWLQGCLMGRLPRCLKCQSKPLRGLFKISKTNYG